MVKKVILGFFILALTLYYIKAEPKPSSAKDELEQILSQHHGKVIYLDFWASWCGPCRKSFPWMNRIQEEYAQQGFVVLSVNLDANESLALNFLLENPANFEVIYDPKGDTAKHFSIKGMPSSLLIGRDGDINSAHTGFDTKLIETYQQKIEALLSHKTT
ncbi:MAG: TlpA family protein disulfide reductase [Colwellia sp.]